MVFAHYRHVMTQQKVQAIEKLPTLAGESMCTNHVHKKKRAATVMANPLKSMVTPE